MSAQYIIYALVDPRTSAVRYIGKSSYGLRRAKKHGMSSQLARDKTYKGNWIRSLLSAGLEYEVRVLQEVEFLDLLDAAEIDWIRRAREEGWPLTNLTNGGEGQRGARFTEEHRRKMSERHRGRKFTEEHRAKISSANKGRKLTEEQRKKLSAAAKKRTLSSEHIEALRQGKARKKLEKASFGYIPEVPS